MTTELAKALDQVARRFRRMRLWIGLTVCWLLWALAVAVLAGGLARASHGPWPVSAMTLLSAVAGAATLAGGITAWLALRSVRDPRRVAHRIEARHPELGTGLLAAVDAEAVTTAGQRGYLQSAVIAAALAHRTEHDWDEIVSTRALDAARLAHTTAFCMVLVAFAALFASTRPRQQELPAPLAATSPAGDIRVEPGNTEIERGSPLLVVARFTGAVPGETTLVVAADKAAEARRKMTRSLDDPTFAGRVESVTETLTYRVDYGGRSSPTFRVTVFEYPELERADAQLVFPKYTALGPRTVDDIRHVTAVEGTELTLLFRTNKDVTTARLLDEKGEAVALMKHNDGPHTYRATLKLTDTKRFRVQLIDREGRLNKRPAELLVNVTRNRPPVVTVTQPAHDVRVSPVEELSLAAKIDDDFGVVRRGLSYAAGGQEPKELVLDGSAPAAKTVEAAHLLDFEALKAAPDQLVTYFFWAEDIGPDEKPRRVSGDMFFAEVRPFEEIFRQGEQPPSGSAENENEQEGGNAQESDKLAELQKNIINGTWTLIRREIGAKPTEKLSDDAKVLLDSQKSAIEQADALGEKLRDASSKASLEQATRAMRDAEKQLGLAAGATSIKALAPALAAEQAAYQALLKLRAREFEVTRNNSRQSRQRGRSSAGSPAQRQLDQLELSNEENRFEEQRAARAQQDQTSQRAREQNETRQVVNRLRELAQRQTDLNDRLKELQSALEAAKDQKAREEIERQLKRLREQEQQILRDTDELRERMEREENRERMAEARQQVEQGREHVRQASEALEQGQLSQALTEGTRAGRQMNELRDDLRKQSSGRFNDEMTELRDQSRKLEENQKALSEQLDAMNKRPQGSLRDTVDRAPVKQGLTRQGEELDKVLDRMRKTVQDAEETEPLLAKELFDSVRKADEQKTPEALKEAEQLAEAGIAEEAARSSRRAGEGLTQLREGVERAARSVLGDETESLRRAQGELDDLADQVNRELAHASGTEPPARPGTPQRPAPATGRDANKAQPKPGTPTEAKKAQAGGRDQQGNPPEDGARKDARGQSRPPGQPQPGQQGDAQSQAGQQATPPQQGQGPERQGGSRERQGSSLREPGGERAAARRPEGSPDGLDRAIAGLADGPVGPITGEGYRQWSDRMRDVEELLDDPQLRSDAARIRDRVRGAREEFKRHSKPPDPNQLKSLVAQPLTELRDRVAEEVRRRDKPDALVPIDRDPVPPQYAEGVRRYYERLGSGR